MRTRFAEFAVSLHPDKTRLIEFGRRAAANRGKDASFRGALVVHFDPMFHGDKCSGPPARQRLAPAGFVIGCRKKIVQGSAGEHRSPPLSYRVDAEDAYCRPGDSLNVEGV
jgi:hypothetical protein